MINLGINMSMNETYTYFSNIVNSITIIIIHSSRMTRYPWMTRGLDIDPLRTSYITPNILARKRLGKAKLDPHRVSEVYNKFQAN